MTANIQLSIVTVCYQAKPLLSKTIASVWANKQPDVEYLVVDGGSTDGSLELIEQSPVIDRYVSEPDGGIYDAMNKAVQLASAPWIIYMNAGDVFAGEDVLRHFMPLLNAEADVVYGDIMKPRADGSLYLKAAHKPGNYHKMFFCHQAAFTRRRLLSKYPFDTSLKLSADFLLYKQLYLAGYRFVYHPHAVAVFDTQGASNRQRSRGLAENISVIRRTDSLFEQIRLLPRLYFTYLMTLIRRK
ncbi:hypothetical protein HQ45_06005 [Porphyromonas crevioricanis]|uniref:Glycosyltransferase 2-like domain-containing protein n=1 Tax=Porphyromonas crevioricanis TaxID=393921 RepID=A0AB34PG75_9PORP|nr:glycosyltransferase family 2 protein [Porphyromonas crevioricanis]KGN90323.1 hypothetical protein HQ45_06005 [Porphyromonas crevioricanis]KGN95337.1 hypothetical protein HQ38_03340 [Porphyromonas crevioricanis]